MRMAGLLIPETTLKVAVFNRNGWQLCAGTGGNFQPEWVAVLLRNMQISSCIIPPLVETLFPRPFLLGLLFCNFGKT